jgi:uracil-DNA glycosylase
MLVRERSSAAAYVADSTSLAVQREAARHCHGCPLYTRATQTVFGEGNAPARLMLVGEQPGDEEDKAGRPFVGPAGRVLDKALATAGIARDDVYVTNAVKHFKWRPYGKRRLHQKPDSGEIDKCKPWLMTEIELVAPEVIVALGTTAAQSLLARRVTISKDRGHPIQAVYACPVVVSYHPSAVLRAPDAAGRHALLALLIADFEVALRSARAEARTSLR